MSASNKDRVGRRSFLSGAASSVAAITAGATPEQPQNNVDVNVNVQTTERPGADFMIDVLKSLKFEYLCANPGSAFRAINESIINYGGNINPEFITCCHEESSVAMAHGYYKVEGKPMLVLPTVPSDPSMRPWPCTTPFATGSRVH